MNSENAKKLLLSRETVYSSRLDTIDKAYDYCEGYKRFLDKSKTEREAVSFAVDAAKANGFSQYDPDKKYAPGDKVYYVNRMKSVMLAVIGSAGPEAGFAVAAAHIDSPRLDLKQHPLYESSDIAYFKSYY